MSCQTVKIVTVGDHASQKSRLMLKYTSSDSQQYLPTIFDHTVKRINIDQSLVDLSLWDTSGQEPYARLRNLGYYGMDVFLIVFSLWDGESFNNAKNKWYIQVRKAVPLAKVLFVGMRNPRKSFSQDELGSLSQEEITDQLKKTTNSEYRQINLLTGQGLDELFQTAAKLALNRPSQSQLSQQNQNRGSPCPCNLI